MKRHLRVLVHSVLISLALILSLRFVETIKAETSEEGLITYMVKPHVTQVIPQLKTVLLRKLSVSGIEDMINQVRAMGGIGYKLNRYAGDKMGWSLNDSKGNETYSVIFSFRGRQASEGEYFSPLMSFRDAEKIHKLFMQVLPNYYRPIETNKYDIGDKCIAVTKLFKGTTGAGRTIITVKCY